MRIQVSDGGTCADEWTVPVTCVGGGGTGGTGGSGSGGTAGTGCQQTCGLNNEFPAGGPVDRATLECSVMGIPIPIDVDLTALSEGVIVNGENTITTAFQTVIPVSVVDLVVNLADSAAVVDTRGVIATTGSPPNVSLGLSPVPCEICFHQGVEVVIPNDPRTDDYTVVGDGIGFALPQITFTLDAAGLLLVLSNTGPDPACAWENDTPPTVILGSGGAGGFGGTGGGTGGTGGSPNGCQQTCGIGNEFPDGSPTDSARLDCSVMGIPVPLDFNFTALADGAIVDGDNSITVVAQTVIPESVVDLILNLADSATIVDTRGEVETTGIPSNLDLILSPVPCEVCFVPDTAVEVTIDPRTQDFEVSGGSIDLDLADVTVTLDAAGLTLVLSTSGDDPACAWANNPPSLTLGPSGPGLCVNPADDAVFDSTQYVDADGIVYFGDAAVGAIGEDCLFGASTLVNPGCGAELGQGRWQRRHRRDRRQPWVSADLRDRQ